MLDELLKHEDERDPTVSLATRNARTIRNLYRVTPGSLGAVRFEANIITVGFAGRVIDEFRKRLEKARLQKLP